MTRLEILEQEQIKDSRVLSAQKKAQRKQWVAEILVLCNTAKGWALRSNPPMLKQLEYRPSDLLRLGMEASVNKGKDIIRVLKDNSSYLTPFGITDDTLGTVLEKIESFEASLPDADEAAKARKLATRALDEQMKEIDYSLNVIDALISGKYAANRELLEEYRVQREVTKPARHATGVRLTVSSHLTGAPEEHAKGVVRELGREAFADIDGVVEFLRVKPGKYHLDIYVGVELKKTLVVQFRRGKMLVMSETV